MDTHIRWKVKRRLRDAQLTLAIILLFVTSQASSGKLHRQDLLISLRFALILRYSVCYIISSGLDEGLIGFSLWLQPCLRCPFKLAGNHSYRIFILVVARLRKPAKDGGLTDGRHLCCLDAPARHRFRHTLHV